MASLDITANPALCSPRQCLRTGGSRWAAPAYSAVSFSANLTQLVDKHKLATGEVGEETEEPSLSKGWSFGCRLAEAVGRSTERPSLEGSGALADRSYPGPFLTFLACVTANRPGELNTKEEK